MSGNQARKSSQSARKRAARLAAVQAVYQMMSMDQSAADIVREYQNHRLGMPVDDQAMIIPDKTLFSGIVSGIEARKEDLLTLVKGALSARAHNTAQESEIELLIQSMLLCGAYELMAHHDIDEAIIISDYIDIAHSFYDGGESKLVNAVLDNIAGGVRDKAE